MEEWWRQEDKFQRAWPKLGTTSETRTVEAYEHEPVHILICLSWELDIS